MLVAVIPPTPHLELAHEGDFYFVLTQRLLEDEQYRAFYTYHRDLKKLVLLDNGAFERGKSLPVDQVLEAAKLVHATEVVAPDFPMHGHESFELTRDFLSVCPKKYRIVALPHGKNPQEFAFYYTMMTKLERVDVIGLSIIFHKQCDRLRPHMYHYLKKTGKFLLAKEHHLFGLDSLAELWCYNSEDIRSVDTSLPISLAWNSLGFEYLKLPLPHKRVPPDAELHSYELWMAKRYIERLKEVARSV